MSSTKKMWIVFGFVSIAFHIYLIFSGLVPNLISRPIHMALILPWIFLYDKNFSNNLISSFIVFLGIFSCLWISFSHESLMDQYGFLEGIFQFSISIIFILFLFDNCRLLREIVSMRSVIKRASLPRNGALGSFLEPRGVISELRGARYVTFGSRFRLVS